MRISTSAPRLVSLEGTILSSLIKTLWKGMQSPSTSSNRCDGSPLLKGAGKSSSWQDLLAEDPDAPLTLQQMYVDVCSKRQKACFNFTVFMLISCYAYAAVWWFSLQKHGAASWTLLDIVVTYLMVTDAFFIISSMFFISQTQQIHPRIPPPKLRVAMITTKVPCEPFEVLQKTLTAMLNQDYPHPYDVWLADEVPTPEVRAWCEQHGVKYSSRYGVKEYHRDTWPRRTRCKEGNLCYFYDHWGYANYDVVCQFDADHVPERSYLSATLPAFRDPNVGYVAAPSVNSDGSEHWSVRGRLYRDAFFHGIGQAMYCQKYKGWMPVCMGSHYSVRTAHLKAIGGIGPELDEDMSTTLMMTWKGFDGSFSLATAAVGEGPPTFEAAMKQEYQWARSSALLLLEYTAPFWSWNIPPQKIYRTARTVSHYTISTFYFCVTIAFVMLPTFGLRFGSFSFPSLFVRFLAPRAVSLVCAYWVRRQGWLRPADAHVFNWESLLHEVCKQLWSARGVFDAFLGHLTGIKFEIKVTPKGINGASLLGAKSIMPMCTFACMFFALALYGSGRFLWPYLSALMYLVAAFAVAALHYREHHREAIPWRNAAALSLPLGLTTVFGLAVTWAHFTALSGLLWGYVPYYGRLLSWDDLAAFKVACSALLVYVVGLGLISYLHRHDAQSSAFVGAFHRQEDATLRSRAKFKF